LSSQNEPDMKRIFLFLATNLAILVVLGVVLSVLGLDSRSTSGALIVAAIFGMGGSFISLAMSKWIAKFSTGAQVIERPSNNVETWLVQTVARQAQQAGIGMPESECRYLVKDFGTSQSPKSTRLRDSLLCPGRPASVPLRHTIASAALATQHSHKWLDGVSDALAYGLRWLRDLRPLRHCGHTPAPTPTGDYPPRASHFRGGQRLPSIRRQTSMPLPLASIATMRWLQSAPGFWGTWTATRRRPCWGMR